MKVLLLEDDAPLAVEIDRVLRRAGHAVDLVTTCAEAEFSATTGQYSCLVFDRTVPDGDGAALITELRRRGDLTPALLITAMDALSDRVAGFDAGADDYLVKPFAAVELIARLRALSRRGQVAVAPVLSSGDVELDVQRHTVRRAGVKLALRAKEFAVLEELLRAEGAVVTRTDLIAKCWDEQHDPASNVVDVVIAQLRKRLGAPDPITTVRGVGYHLVTGARRDP